jgi:hypothetical protein
MLLLLLLLLLLSTSSLASCMPASQMTQPGPDWPAAVEQPQTTHIGTTAHTACLSAEENSRKIYTVLLAIAQAAAVNLHKTSCMAQ